MRFVQFNPHRHGHWVKKIIKPLFTEDTRGIVAERKDGSPAGAVILDSWTENSVQGHLGAETPIVWKAGLHKEAFKYVFEIADRKVFLGLTPADKKAAIKFNLKVGFIEIARIKDGFSDGIDYILFEMRKENCRYLSC